MKTLQYCTETSTGAYEKVESKILSVKALLLGQPNSAGNVQPTDFFPNTKHNLYHYSVIKVPTPIVNVMSSVSSAVIELALQV